MDAARPAMVMAGGTGGHIFPALAVVKELRQRGVEVVWLGSTGGLEERIATDNAIDFRGLEVAGVRGKGLSARLLFPFRLLAAVIAAMKIQRRLRPRVALGLGGFASGPGGLAALLLRIPLLVHEQNAIPGMTNRYLASLGARALEGFEGSFSQRGLEAEYVGNPVRADIDALTEVQRDYARDGAAQLKLLVLGGSLGAVKLNQVVPGALAKIDPELRPSVRHQTGAKNIDSAKARYAEQAVEADVVAFIDDMAESYRWADLVIARSGALTVAELTCAGLPAIFVPYPHAVDDHQTLNARSLVEGEAALMVADHDLDASRLAELLYSLLADADQLQHMSRRARSFSRPGATSRVVDRCLEMAL